MRPLTINTPLLINAAAIAVAVWMFGSKLPALPSALFTEGLENDETSAFLSEYLENHAVDLQTYQARIDGRSVFFLPPAPKEPTQIKPVQEAEPLGTPPPPPPPPNYTGPSVRFLVGNEVYFHDGLRIKLGEEKQGIRILAVDAPWTVNVAHAGGEYELTVFEQLVHGIEKPPSKRHAPTPGLLVVDTPQEPATNGRRPDLHQQPE